MSLARPTIFGIRSFLVFGFKTFWLQPCLNLPMPWAKATFCINGRLSQSYRSQQKHATIEKQKHSNTIVIYVKLVRQRLIFRVPTPSVFRYRWIRQLRRSEFRNHQTTCFFNHIFTSLVCKEHTSKRTEHNTTYDISELLQKSLQLRNFSISLDRKQLHQQTQRKARLVLYFLAMSLVHRRQHKRKRKEGKTLRCHW